LIHFYKRLVDGFNILGVNNRIENVQNYQHAEGEAG